MRSLIALWLAICVLGLAASPAHADELRPGYLAFTQTDATHWTLVWKAPVRGGITPATQPVLPAGCIRDGAAQRAVEPLSVTTTQQVICRASVEGKQIGLSAMATAQNDVLVRVAPLDRPVQALRLTAREPVATIAERPNRWAIARTYFVIGVEHILFGYDHLLFVVALVLLLSGFRTIAWAVTAFTLAHSLTLVGTTLGVMGLPQAPVEAVIALSIVFLAVEVVKKRPDQQRLSERIPWVVAFLFGLLHGFGFAGALKEVGLPDTDVPTALLLFNVGVEAGQLVIVAVTLALLTLLRRMGPAIAARAVRIAAYAIGMIASMWLIERVLP